MQSYVRDPDQDLTTIANNQGIVIGRVLSILPNLGALTQMITEAETITLEMSVLYFLESLCEQTISDVSFDDGVLTTSYRLFLIGSQHQNLFDSLDRFLILCINKCLQNFSYRESNTSKFSIEVISSILIKLKKKLNREQYAVQATVSHLREELRNINRSALSETKFYEFRSDLYQIIGQIYLDDIYDDYVGNAKTVLSEIFQLNLQTKNIGVGLIRLFYDLIGILRAISMTNIFVVFIKLSYSRVQELIEKEGVKYVEDEEFMNALLSFYDIMCKNCLDKLQRDSNAVFFKVINDAFVLLTSIVNECNNAISEIQDEEKLKEFVSAKSKMLFMFVSIFNKIVSGTSLNFSIFHFFENKTFLNFLKAQLDFHFLLLPVVYVRVG